MTSTQTVLANKIGDTNATLWGRAFDVSDPKGREQAAAWFAQQCETLLGIRLADLDQGKSKFELRKVDL